MNYPKKRFYFLRIIKEKNISGDEYKVQLSNGIKVDFDMNGEWTQVEAGVANQSVGSLFLPQISRDYLNKNYSEIGIKSIDKDSRGIDVELLNNIDLKFDLNGNFTCRLKKASLRSFFCVL